MTTLVAPLPYDEIVELLAEARSVSARDFGFW